jgi:enamine deaminase RidA (YjgF/YER057c/UK114 family)
MERAVRASPVLGLMKTWHVPAKTSLISKPFSHNGWSRKARSDQWPAFNAIYAKWIGASRPDRAVVPVPELHFGFKIEIEAVAAVAQSDKLLSA